MRGHNYLRQLPDPAPAGTAPLLRVLLGACLGWFIAWAWMEADRTVIEDQRVQQQILQTDVQQLEGRLREGAEQARQVQAMNEQRARVQVWQAHRQLLLAMLEDLARASGARLTQLSFDGQVLSVHGRMAPGLLQAWAAARSLPGLGPPELSELSLVADPPVPGGSSGSSGPGGSSGSSGSIGPGGAGGQGAQVHFVLRWTVGAKGQP